MWNNVRRIEREVKRGGGGMEKRGEKQTEEGRRDSEREKKRE